MEAAFLFYLKNNSESYKKAVAIMPFYDNQVGRPDPLLAEAIPFLIYDVFSPQHAEFIHPYLGIHTANALGLTGEALFRTESANQFAKKLNARFVIQGAYQLRLDGRIRVWLNVYDAKEDKALSPAIEFDTDFNDSFFELIKQKLKLAFDKTPSARRLKASRYNMPGLAAFRQYARGLQHAGTYDSARLELAVIWFEKALKTSYQNFDEAALGLARAYFMQALVQKLSKGDASQSWSKGKKALTLLKHKNNTGDLKHRMVTRFLEGSAVALEALTARLGGDQKRAHELARKGLGLVPEDGMLQYLYVLTGSGKKNEIVSPVNPVCF